MKVLAVKLAVVIAAVGFALAALEGILAWGIDRLPIPTLVFLHRDLKDRHPRVYATLREAVPNLNRRREDMDLGWTFRPSMHVSGTNEEGEHYDRTSTAEGFFSPDVPDPSTPQLIVLGDSFLSTFVVPRPVAWVMRDHLGQPVYNLSVGGWGPETYRAAYEKLARNRKHSRVVVFTFINDITDVVNWQAWQAEGVAGMSFLTWIQRANPDGERVNTHDSWLDRHSLLVNLVRQATWRRPASRTELAPSAVAGGSEWFDDQKGGRFEMHFIDGMPFAVHDPESFLPGGSYYGYLQSYFESLERLRRSIESAGAEMTLVWIPSKERVYFPLLSADRRASHVTNATGDIGSLERLMTRYAAQVRLPFLDLTPVLEASARAGRRVYFAVDGHLNNEGNDVVGRAVSTFLTTPPAPALVASEDRLPFRSGSLAIEIPVRLDDSLMRSPLIAATPSGWSVRGRADSQYGYVVQWPEREVGQPMFLTVRGRIRKGGVTVGLLENAQWASTFNITAKGRFDVAVPIMKAGRYVLTLAHCLTSDDFDTDIEIDEIGWTPVSGEAQQR